MLNDIEALEKIFSKAKSVIVNGEKVVLVRKTATSPVQKFDEFSTLEELDTFRASVFKYISH